MKKPTLIVHIGYPKTATTSLQVHVLKNLHASGKMNFLGNSEITGLNDVVSADRFIRLVLFRNFHGHDLHEKLRRNHGYLSGMLEGGVINILSSEYLCIPHSMDCNLGQIPQRVKEAFGNEVDYKIVMTIRQQESLAMSYFSHFFPEQFIYSDKINDPDKFFRHISNRNDELSLNFDFFQTAERWGRVFGKSAIFINFYEDFLFSHESASEFWGSILNIPRGQVAELMGEAAIERKKKKIGSDYVITVSREAAIKRNRGRYSKEKDGMKADGILKKVFWTAVRRAPPLKFRLKRPSDEVAKLVMSRFSGSNYRLHVEYGVNLDKLRQYEYLPHEGEVP